MIVESESGKKLRGVGLEQSMGDRLICAGAKGKTQAGALKKAEEYRCKIVDQKEEGKLARDGKTFLIEHGTHGWSGQK